ASSGLVSVALLGYSIAPSWNTLFPIGVLVGLGSGAIDTGLNDYAARHFSARSVNWLHACWGIGASIGPALMTAAITQEGSFRLGYAALAAIIGCMALAFIVTRRQWNDSGSPGSDTRAQSASPKASMRSALASRAVWLQVAMFWLYTGLEASIGQWCFTWMREANGLSVALAGFWNSAYWASLTLGRILLGSIVNWVGADRLLRIAGVTGVLGTVLFISPLGPVSRIGLALLGFSLAPFFPTLIARTPARVGASISRYSIGFQVSAATLGAAMLPAAIGFLISHRGIHSLAIVLVGLSVAVTAVHEVLCRAGTA
ncbi:MAG TPA: MFS transporter, partial [Polyangiaceae bacterium]|nr:MFS transporter [Polyangiaceae bacterium]